MSDVSKLPAWPEEEWLPRIYQKNTAPWVKQERDAYRARMEALVEVVKRYRNETPLGHQPHMIAHEVDALLAACVRGEGR